MPTRGSTITIRVAVSLTAAAVVMGVVLWRSTTAAITCRAAGLAAFLMPGPSETEMRLGIGLRVDQRIRVGVNSMGVVELL